MLFFFWQRIYWPIAWKYACRNVSSAWKIYCYIRVQSILIFCCLAATCQNNFQSAFSLSKSVQIPRIWILQVISGNSCNTKLFLFRLIGFDYHMSQSIFNLNIEIYIINLYKPAHRVSFKYKEIMVTYQGLKLCFKSNIFFQISRATTTLSFYQDCISNLSRASFITASIHHSVRVSGDAGCHYPSSDHLIPLPSGIFSSCLIGKQTEGKKENSTHKAKTISVPGSTLFQLQCLALTDK